MAKLHTLLEQLLLGWLLGLLQQQWLALSLTVRQAHMQSSQNHTNLGGPDCFTGLTPDIYGNNATSRTYSLKRCRMTPR